MSEPKTPHDLVEQYVERDYDDYPVSVDAYGLERAIVARDEQIRQQERIAVVRHLRIGSAKGWNRLIGEIKRGEHRK